MPARERLRPCVAIVLQPEICGKRSWSTCRPFIDGIVQPAVSHFVEKSRYSDEGSTLGGFGGGRFLAFPAASAAGVFAGRFLQPRPPPPPPAAVATDRGGGGAGG